MHADRHVHFHVIPRYSGARRIDGIEFRDAAWPAHYEVGATKSVSRRTIAGIQDALDVAAPH
jgi:diadenosine tetraphosphate (Ap4A) HIT family hydrolase